MKIEIHWPVECKYLHQSGESITHLDENCKYNDADKFYISMAIAEWSFIYDVIIDNGKVTFVDKE